MEKFSPKTIEELNHYVYVLLDPEEKKYSTLAKGRATVFFNMQKELSLIKIKTQSLRQLRKFKIVKMVTM
ncbi:MAG: hypothetical protein KAH48_06055 [Chlorobi bacterium]|nr:hypothetical protein [Chlorobiota bacterium]